MLCLMLTAALLLAGCGNSGNKNSNTGDKRALRIVTTMFAAYDFSRQLCDDTADITLLLKPGSESHTFEPTPADIAKIGKCDIFIYPGGENDAWVDKILESVDMSDKIMIKMLDCVNPLEEELVEGMQDEDGHDEDGHDEDGHDEDGHDEEDGENEEHEGHHHEDDETEWDEHVWMSPVNAGLICRAITDAAIAKDGNADAYNERYNNYAAQLDGIDSKFRELVGSARRSTIVFADRFPARYFTEEYGLTYFAAFPGCAEDAEPSAATVSFLIDKVKAEQIPVVFSIELSSGKLAEAISESTGAKVGTFYSMHNVTAQDFEAGVTYIDLMMRNYEALQTALN